MRVKAVTLLFCLGVVVGALDNAQAQTVRFAGAGSSAMWQNFALAAFNGTTSNHSPQGSCVAKNSVFTPVPPCFHYTAKGFLLHDNRGSATVPIADEAGNIWIVWDSAPVPNVWAYINVDSVVGNRCYFGAATGFAHACSFKAPAGGFPAPGNLITLTGSIWWGNAADQTPPAAIQALFTTGPFPATTAAMTDIRPEDAMYAQCRANSQLDATNTKKGLGYNGNIAAGECPVFGFTPASQIGAQVLSSFSTKFAQTVPFNIVGGGKDPITGATVVKGQVRSVGASPIVFIFSRKHGLSGLTNANCCNDTQLQGLYTAHNASGSPDPNAKELGQPAAGLNVLQREPLSGTMNTTEFNVFRNDPFQTLYSQEDDVNPPGDNPLKQSIDGGGRFRVIGTGEMVSEVNTITAPGNTGLDTFGYAFFSFGNVSSIANLTSFGYTSLDGLNPIFAGKGGASGDPGDPGNSELPGAPFPAGAGCAGNNFPCGEANLWKGKLSFPNVRACTASGNTGYRAWSILRLVSDGTNLTNANSLIAGAQSAAIHSVPDFVSVSEFSCYRSHYAFKVTNTNGTTTTINPQNGLAGQPAEAGRDVGGCQEKKPVSGPGVLNLGQEYAPNGTPGACHAPVFP